MPEITKLLRRTKNKINKDKCGENGPHLEINEVVLMHCNIVNSDHQQDSRVLYTPNKTFGQLLNISPKDFVFLKSLIQNFYILKYGLLIKLLNYYR